ncbi:hypothetical protein GF376_00535 [Candidatus Peregrinibacteria bacterium]|nr:hypothetical protein [Candidatus Peregrinibacteria bacterium]
MFDSNNKNRELSMTSESAAGDRFDDILQKLLDAGATIENDEETPLYYDTGHDEIKMGERRVIRFDLNDKDFEITREVKRRRILGTGNKRSYQDLEVPIIELKLKNKDKLSDQWTFIDLEDLF